MHDVHDWLGGYPYEVVSLAEMRPKYSGSDLLKFAASRARRATAFSGRVAMNMSVAKERSNSKPQ